MKRTIQSYGFVLAICLLTGMSLCSKTEANTQKPPRITAYKVCSQDIDTGEIQCGDCNYTSYSQAQSRVQQFQRFGIGSFRYWVGFCVGN